MLPELEALLILQERDQKVSGLKADLEAIPEEAAAIAAKLKQQSAHLEAARGAARLVEADRKKLELEVEARKAAIARYAKQQLDTRKNEEYQALGHEIEHAEKEIVAFEDTELELMAKYEQAQKDLAAEQASVKTFESQATQKQADLAKKKSVLDAELAKYLGLQAESEKSVEEGLLKKYRRILASKHDTAIVPTRSGSCGGCHMKLTSQTMVVAKGGQALVTCENCGRFVYWSE